MTEKAPEIRVTMEDVANTVVYCPTSLDMINNPLTLVSSTFKPFHMSGLMWPNSHRYDL